MFDLNEEVKQWRSELLSGDSVSETDADELENHLRETFGDLQAKLESADEAFWLAVRRIGSPDAISLEFSKINTTHIWRRRALWMLAGFLILSLVGRGVTAFDTAIAMFVVYQGLPLWIAFGASSVGFTIFLVGITCWTWNASHGQSLGLQGVSSRLGDRARSGSYASLVFLTLLALGLSFCIQSGVLLASSRLMTPMHFGVAHLVQSMTSIPKSGLLYGIATALVCWLAQKDGHGQSKRPGQWKACLQLLLFGSAILLGFALLSNAVGPWAGAQYSSFGR